MNNHQKSTLFANSGKAAKEQAEHQLGNFLNLSLSRAKQTSLKNWKKPSKKL